MWPASRERVAPQYLAAAGGDNAPEVIIDNFAGGGGATEGIEAALCRPVDVAINHDPEAVSMHQANHRQTRHYCENVWEVNPREVLPGRRVGLLWLSPDCKHHSKAKGGKPVEKNIRGLAWVAVRWVAIRRPRRIMLENVEEFQDWGPLTKDANGDLRPCKKRKGQEFKAFVNALRRHGYAVEWKELRACDYGAPTIRKRLFLIARCDGQPIVWPVPTHGDPKSVAVKNGELKPWRTAADCIDWTLPCPSIFLSKEEGRAIGVNRPLADATLRRIAKGIMRYVINAAEPFIVPLTHQGADRRTGMAQPVPTVTAAHRGELALVTTKIDKAPTWDEWIAATGKLGGTRQEYDRLYLSEDDYGQAYYPEDYAAPFITEHANGSTQRNMAADEPLRTQCAQVKGGHFALVAPTLVQTGYGEREGQAPRAPGLDKPLGTVVAGGTKHALVEAFLEKHQDGNCIAAFMAKNYGGVVGHGLHGEPLHTVTSTDHNSLVTSNLVKMRGTNVGQPDTEPLHTLSAQGTHFAEVRAMLIKYYGTDQDPQLRDPLHTVTTKDRYGLVTVHGEQYAIADVGLRMLAPRELFRAQGFRESYIIDRGLIIDQEGNILWKPLSKTAQVRMCGNSVCPPLAAALVRANCQDMIFNAEAGAEKLAKTA